MNQLRHNAYDTLGRRTAATNALGQVTYTANALNQYTAIANPDAVGLRGDATNTAVTVNGEAVQSDNIASDTIPWHFALEADNGSGPDFPFAEIVAVVNPPGTNTPDIVSTAGGHLYAPPQNETLTYDDDGNLTSDGRWHYTWNGENRLIKAEELVSPTNRQPCTVEYAYDHQGRRIAAATAAWTNDAWLAVEDRAFIYDGWNVIRETVAVGSGSPQSVSTNLYTWGLDLSGSIQGAGGIGGLLAVSLDGTTAFYGNDANGNVGQLVDIDGDLLAHYEYSPFGETIVSTGPLAKANPFRFSTKHWDDLTGLGYWGYRWYSPAMGRWLSRDPIGERASPNRFTSCCNNVVNLLDPVGLFDKNIGKDGLVDITVYHCEIVILDGHGDPVSPHRFHFATNECVGAVFLGCHPGVTNEKIPPEFLVPGACMDKPRYPGDRSSEKTDYKWGTIPPLRKAVYEGAQEMASGMCDCCDNVIVTFTATQPAPKWWQIGADPPRNDTIYIYDCKASTWERQPGGQDGYPIYGPH